MKAKLILWNVATLFLFLCLSNTGFAASAIHGSYDTDKKVFNNWCVYKTHLKDGEQCVIVDSIQYPSGIFRIMFDKNKPTMHGLIFPMPDSPDIELQMVRDTNLQIAGRTYSMQSAGVINRGFLVIFLDMPSDFMSLAKKNNSFILTRAKSSFSPNPIRAIYSLAGFNDAIKYALQLQKTL